MSESYDLENGFYRHLISLSVADITNLKPTEIFDAEAADLQLARRGVIMKDKPNTIGFGNGVYSRTYGLYQIDLWVLRTRPNALEELKTMSDNHVVQFFPTNGRGLTIIEGDAQAHISSKPGQTFLGREGAYIREVVEVDFYIDP